MSKPTQTLLDAKAREAILNGVNSIYEPVRRTLGPVGENALLYGTYGREPRITNDGYTVAGCQEPKNPFIRVAADTFGEACRKTNEIIGDATTATTIIGGRLFNDAYNIVAGSQNDLIGSKNNSVNDIKKEILDTADTVKKEVEKKAKKVKSLEELTKIAAISVEDEKLGEIIAKMSWEVGVDGFIDTVEGYKGEIETEVIKGMRFPAKVAGKGFVNNPKKNEMLAVDCPVIVTDYAINNTTQLAKFLNPIIKKYSKIIIFAPSFSQQVLEMMFKAMFTIDNRGAHMKTGTEIFPVAVPSLRQEQFDDLAIYCDARFACKDKGDKLEGINVEDVGFLEKLIIKDTEIREDAIATGGAGTKLEVIKDKDTGFEESDVKRTKTPIQERIEILKAQLVEEKKGETFKNILKKRIASMSSAIGVIKVGDSTHASSFYRKLKVEDAVYACKAALRGGYVKGGGVCLKEIADKLPANNIMKNALIEPYDIIQESTNGKDITDDIIDPAEALYYAVEHASSVVANLITCGSITVETEPPMAEEGGLAIAKMVRELVANDKIEKGLMKEGEAEYWKDTKGGLSDPEFEDTFRE